MVLCPECETDLDVEEEEVDEGEIVSCPECGTDFEVVTTSPLELKAVEEGYVEEEEEVHTFQARCRHHLMKTGAGLMTPYIESRSCCVLFMMRRRHLCRAPIAAGTPDWRTRVVALSSAITISVREISSLEIGCRSALSISILPPREGRCGISLGQPGRGYRWMIPSRQ